MRNILFLGNGLNRCVTNNLSWNELLKDISNCHSIKLNPDISLPLQFECIANQILTNGYKIAEDIYKVLKSEIVEKIKSMEPNTFELHKQFSSLPVSAIITTNYDYFIEKSIDSSFSPESDNRNKSIGNTKYPLNYFIEIANKKIFHMHGELNYIKTICLGYEHYAGMLQHMREEVNGGIKAGYDKWLNKDDFALLKLFFTDNIFIVGFGLSQSEIDLWWIFTYRAFFFGNNKSIKPNRIFFYDIRDEIDGNMKYALESLMVDYVFVKRNKDEEFENKYKKVANIIKDKI